MKHGDGTVRRTCNTEHFPSITCPVQSRSHKGNFDEKIPRLLAACYSKTWIFLHQNLHQVLHSEQTDDSVNEKIKSIVKCWRITKEI